MNGELAVLATVVAVVVVVAGLFLPAALPLGVLGLCVGLTAARIVSR